MLPRAVAFNAGSDGNIFKKFIRFKRNLKNHLIFVKKIK